MSTEGVRADHTPSRLHTIVDANNGAILSSFDEIRNGTGNGIFAGTVPIDTTAGATGAPFSMRDVVGDDITDLNNIVDNTARVHGLTVAATTTTRSGTASR